MARRLDWVVYAKRPVAVLAQVLTYLARYTHRVAIANSRLLTLEDGKVYFSWKDYRHAGRTKVMTLDAMEFSPTAAVDSQSVKSAEKDDTQLARRFEILLSIPGVSKIAAFALLIEMPELGSLEGKQAASLAGLAPVQRQSGSWKRRAYIRGGRAFLL